MQLFSLTGVQPDRQKIIVKGGILKDDGDWSTLGVKQGQTFMLMGTPAENAAAAVDSTPAVQFMEDMNQSEVNRALRAPSGLQNLGNTCYMNATLQCLYAVPELTKSLSSFGGTTTNADPTVTITASLRDTFKMMSTSGQTVIPLVLLQLFRTAYPQFAQRSQEGPGYAQQDADECWSQIVTVVGQNLKADDGKSIIDDIMGVHLKSEWANSESADEPHTYTTDKAIKLSCHINADVGTLEKGIQESLKESIEKQSPLLGRQAVYTKTTRITRLPVYLVVNFVRFFWRQDTQKKAKILRKVKFPFILDTFSFCSEDLKKQLQPAREQILAHDEAVLAVQRENKTRSREEPKPLPELKLVKPENSNDNVSGFYELAAVLTHQGRTADSGHYIAWVRHTEDIWWKFDDDKVSQVTADEIGKLDGGGEWHMAYQCIYRERTN